jgi:hypothetical protein
MTILFSPLGLAYGTLYSAILLTRPQRVVVVTSPEAIKYLHDALDAARFYHSKFEHEAHILEDPLGGFDEARKLARQLAKSPGECNIINLTGGTTVLQECVRSAGDILRRGDAQSAPGSKPQKVDVREVAVVDRRLPTEQVRHPLVVGELVEVSPL